MAYDIPDVYHQPEAFGLAIVAQIEKNLSYEFNMFVVWKSKDGKFYFAEDSGNSCLSPFEDVNSLDELKEFTKHDFSFFESVVQDWLKIYENDDYNPSPLQITEFKQAVKTALEGGQ